MPKFKVIALVLVFLFLAPGAESKMRVIKLGTDFTLPAPRWMFGEDKGKRATGVIGHLAMIRKSQMESKPNTCLAEVGKLIPQAPGLRPWVAVARLNCATELLKKNKRRWGPLSRAVVDVENHKDWLLSGSHSSALRKAYVAGLLKLLDRQVDKDRAGAWKTVDKLTNYKGWLNQNQRAQVFRVSGELAFVQQDFRLAYELISRSLDEKESRQLRERLNSIEKHLLSQGDLPKSEQKKNNDSSGEALLGTEEERSLTTQMQRELNSGDLVSAVEVGVKLIRKYPGGIRADSAAKKIRKVYLGLAGKRDKKYTLLRQRVLKQMKKCDPQRLYKWSRSAYARGYYGDALSLAEQSYDGFKGTPMSTSPLMLAGKAAVAIGEYGTASKHFKLLFREHTGTEAGSEAIYRAGLVEFRERDFSQAAAHFERYLALDEDRDFELQARYWLWRAMQKSESPKAKEVAEAMIRRYPLTYYGLRARAELNQGKLVWPEADANEKLQVKLWLTNTESAAWERYNLLVQAGWFNEAQAELKLLPRPTTPEEMLIHARLFALAFDHHQASLLANRAWELRPELLNKQSASIIYPREFTTTVEKYAKAHSIEDNLIVALVKQESAFRVDAVSPARAMGLMQLMPPTAREVARNLKKKNLRLPEDLFKPETNLRFGIYYMKRMQTAFGGHVPLSLAAYNVGIGNMRKWLRSRKAIKNLQKEKTSNYELEVWVDELPWAETSFYVKAILRNLLVYRLLDKGEVPLSEPIWVPPAQTKVGA